MDGLDGTQSGSNEIIAMLKLIVMGPGADRPMHVMYNANESMGFNEKGEKNKSREKGTSSAVLRFRG